MVAALRSGDAGDCAEYIASSYVDHQGRHGAPLSGPHGFEQVVRAAHRNTAPQLIVQDMIVSDTRAVARIRWRFSPSAENDGVERETIEIVRVEGGHAVEHWGAESWSRKLPGEAV